MTAGSANRLSRTDSSTTKDNSNRGVRVRMLCRSYQVSTRRSTSAAGMTNTAFPRCSSDRVYSSTCSGPGTTCGSHVHIARFRLGLKDPGVPFRQVSFELINGVRRARVLGESDEVSAVRVGDAVQIQELAEVSDLDSGQPVFSGHPRGPNRIGNLSRTRTSCAMVDVDTDSAADPQRSVPRIRSLSVMATVPSSWPPARSWWPPTVDDGEDRRKIKQPRRAGCSGSRAEASSCSPAAGSSYYENR
jgi:hypothetical protein